MDAREVQGNVVLKLIEMLSLLLDSKVLPLSLSVFLLSSLPFLSLLHMVREKLLVSAVFSLELETVMLQNQNLLREKGKIYCQIYSIF